MSSSAAGNNSADARRNGMKQEADRAEPDQVEADRTAADRFEPGSRPEGTVMGRSNQVKLKRRVQEVMQLILAGAEYHDVRQYAAEHDWGVSERQTRRYVAAAYR